MAISKQIECMRLDDDDQRSMECIIKLATAYEDIQDLDSDEESFADLYAVIEGRARSKPSISSLDDIKQQAHSKSARFSSRLEEDKRIHRTSTVLQSEHDHRQSVQTRRHVVRSHSPPPVAGSGSSSRQHQPSRDTPLEQRYRFHQENMKMKRAPLSSVDRVPSGAAYLKSIDCLRSQCCVIPIPGTTRRYHEFVLSVILLIATAMKGVSCNLLYEQK